MKLLPKKEKENESGTMLSLLLPHSNELTYCPVTVIGCIGVCESY